MPLRRRVRLPPIAPGTVSLIMMLLSALQRAITRTAAQLCQVNLECSSARNGLRRQTPGGAGGTVGGALCGNECHGERPRHLPSGRTALPCLCRAPQPSLRSVAFSNEHMGLSSVVVSPAGAFWSPSQAALSAVLLVSGTGALTMPCSSEAC